MLKLIIGVKGTGKTKTLISMVNEAVEKSEGTVVCIEKGVGLRFDVKYTARLINTNDYLIFDAEALYGFVAGILASNHDVTDLFIDSALKIANNDIAGFETFLKEVDELANKLDVNVVMTSSIPAEEASDLVKKYI
ncbi:MAG: ATP-binding protein [Clostridia bacterium]|nr:ATP-binding protein [Clostridia bacterium]